MLTYGVVSFHHILLKSLFCICNYEVVFFSLEGIVPRERIHDDRSNNLFVSAILDYSQKTVPRISTYMCSMSSQGYLLF